MRPLRRHAALSSASPLSAEARPTSRPAARSSGRALAPHTDGSERRGARREALIGATVDGLRIGDQLGEGSSCLVLEVTRISDGMMGAIKVLRPSARRDREHRAALRREADVLRICVVEGIPALLGEGTLPDGSPYVAMERVRGESLAHFVGRHGKLEPAAAIAVIQRAAAILARVHEAGFMHGDLKPDHIFVSPGKHGSLAVQIVDFGTAQRVGAQNPTPGFVVGTPQYMAPEQAEGVADLDGRADVYALGAILYELLSGRRLMTGSSSLALIARLLVETPPRLALVAPEVSLALDCVVGSAIEREREHRCRTALGLAVALVPHARDRVEAERRFAEALRLEPARRRTKSAPALRAVS